MAWHGVTTINCRFNSIFCWWKAACLADWKHLCFKCKLIWTLHKFQEAFHHDDVKSNSMWTHNLTSVQEQNNHSRKMTEPFSLLNSHCVFFIPWTLCIHMRRQRPLFWIFAYQLHTPLDNNEAPNSDAATEQQHKRSQVGLTCSKVRSSSIWWKDRAWSHSVGDKDKEQCPELGIHSDGLFLCSVL